MKRHLNTIFVFIFTISLIVTGCKTSKQPNFSLGNNPSIITSKNYIDEGNKQLDKKNYTEALAQFDKAVKMDSANGEAYSGRGMAKYHLKDLKGAIDDYDNAISLIPNFGEVYDLRGIAKADLGDKVGACKDWNTAFEMGFNKAFDLIEKYCDDSPK